MGKLKRHWHLLLLAACLSLVLFLTLRPYGFQVSALMHIDRSLTSIYPFPGSTVELSVPGYDGMGYYQMARNMPKLFQPHAWGEIRSLSPGPYAHQRFLLPLLAFILSFGSDSLLPWVFLLINITSLLLTCIVITSWKRDKKGYALALALCPAALIGLHFSLAEPLSLFLVTLFGVCYMKRGRLDGVALLSLVLLVLTREIHILLVLGVLGLSLWKRQWHDLLLLVIPIGTFLLLHTFIFRIFGEIPFLWSTEKNSLPFLAVGELLTGKKGFGLFTLSSLALFFFFVVPACVITTVDLLRIRRLDPIPVLVLFFLGVMLAMPDHIWGSITSIGRVITPVYPLFIIHAASVDRVPHRMVVTAIGILGVVAGLGLAVTIHPHRFL